MCSTLICRAHTSWRNQREARQREAARGLAWPSQLECTLPFLLEREDLGTSLLLFPGKMFRQETKSSFLVMEYSALLINVFEALNLLLMIFNT